MKYQFLGDTDNPLVEVALGTGETLRLESGGMVYMQDVELEGKMNSDTGGIGGFFKAIARSVTSGESMFVTIAHGTGPNGRIGIAPSTPGIIRLLEVGERQYCLNTGAFLACDENVNYELIAQNNIGKVLFGGTGGIFVMKTNGYGDLLVNAFGDIIELEVTEDKPLIIDNMHVVAWDSSLDYNIRVASGTIGFKSGEGLVNEFHGNGKILIQTRNIRSLANDLIPFLPKDNSSSSSN